MPHTTTSKQIGSATLTYDNKSATLPVLSGSIGPAVADIRKIQNDLGIFTFDPS